MVDTRSAFLLIFVELAVTSRPMQELTPRDHSDLLSDKLRLRSHVDEGMLLGSARVERESHSMPVCKQSIRLVPRNRENYTGIVQASAVAMLHD